MESMPAQKRNASLAEVGTKKETGLVGRKRGGIFRFIRAPSASQSSQVPGARATDRLVCTATAIHNMVTLLPERGLQYRPCGRSSGVHKGGGVRREGKIIDGIA